MLNAMSALGRRQWLLCCLVEWTAPVGREKAKGLEGGHPWLPPHWTPQVQCLLSSCLPRRCRLWAQSSVKTRDRGRTQCRCWLSHFVGLLRFSSRSSTSAICTGGKEPPSLVCPLACPTLSAGPPSCFPSSHAQASRPAPLSLSLAV